MRPTLSAAVVAILLIAFAAGTAALRAQTPVLHIPVLLSLTGQAAFVGKGEQQDLTLIQDIVNRRGGINGRQVSFDIQDDASNTQTTLQLANGVLAGKPPLMIGPTLTQDCNAMAPLVKDNGPGMPSEEAARVFERFYRVDASRARSHGGSGLGLSIVAAIVTAHGGTVSAASTPGEGLVVTVLIPLSTVELPHDPAAATDELSTPSA